MSQELRPLETLEETGLRGGALRGGTGRTLTFSSLGPGDFLKEPKVYEDLTDLAVLKTAMENALNDYNLSPSVVPMQLVLFREAIEHSEHWLPPRPFNPSLPQHQVLEVVSLPYPSTPPAMPLP